MSGNQYLFLFTIGPVQSFIAQARKTRDLYAGSAILGDIINTEIEYLQDKYRAEIIVPYPKSSAKPNRIVLTIDCNTDTEVRAFGQDLERVAREQWIKHALESLDNTGICPVVKGIRVENFDAQLYRTLLNNHESCLDLPSGYRQQICDFLEVYWVATKSTSSYSHDYNQVQHLLNAVKQTRHFNQLREPAGRKCALDGERNALFYLSSVQNGRPPQFIQKEAKEIQQNQHLMTPGEGLSAVSLTKRFYKQEQGFPSTAKIALWNILAKIDTHKKNGYKNQFGQFFDEQLYYEENLTENYFRKHLPLPKDQLDHLISQLESLERQRAELFEGYRQSKYYALLAFDGDDMGRIWSGDFLQEQEINRLESFQKDLATHLGKFADEAKLIVREPHGATVYTGGDDFLGFVNLHSLIDVMATLRQKYDELVSKPLEQGYGFDNKLSFSAGIVIAHYKEPLGEVLKYVRQAEKDAKAIDSRKDAFSLMVLKGSGERVAVRSKWYIFTNQELILEKIQCVIGGLSDSENGFTNTFLHTLDREFRPLIDRNGVFWGSPIVEGELKRLLARSSIRKKKEDVDRFYPHVYRLYRHASKLDDFFSFLHVCDFMHKELNNV